MDEISDLPASPWAERFPVPGTVFVDGGTRHSLLAPKNPSIQDPKYYFHETNPRGPAKAKSNKDIDMLKWSEAIQHKRLMGARTFQLGVINRYLMFMTRPSIEPIPRGYSGYRRASIPERLFSRMRLSGLPQNAARPRNASGPRKLAKPNNQAPLPAPRGPGFQIYESNRIKVNENTWFPFLRKDRWFDWTQYSLDDNKPPRVWSVDDDRVWQPLSIALELANRILRTLIVEKHDFLRTLIYGRWDYWSNFEDVLGEEPRQDATVLLSYNKEMEICAERGTNVCEFDQTVTATAKQVRDRLNWLLEQILWSFGYHPGALGKTYLFPPAGDRGSPYVTMTTIHIELLESLFNPDLTVGELCTIQTLLANVILHEVAHAIATSRSDRDNDDYAGNRINMETPFFDDPYVDGNGPPELGFAFQQSLFRGIPSLLPWPGHIGTPPPLGMVLIRWPNVDYANLADENSSYVKDGAEETLWHVPSTWPSKLLSETFWSDAAFPRKSDGYFHNPRLFFSKARIQDRDRATVRPLRHMPLDRVDDRYTEAKELLDDWESQMDLWNDFRSPWYEQASGKWRDSPWSKVFLRLSIQEFEGAFAKKDHIACVSIADSFIKEVPWTEGYDKYVDYMPKAGEFSWDWVLHAIGLLMYASIPLRRGKIRKQIQGPLPRTHELTPSKSAAADGHYLTVYVEASAPRIDTVTAAASVLYDQTRPGRGKVDVFTQFDYLTLIDSMIKLIIGLRGSVHEEFLNAILAAKRALHKDRERIQREYTGRAQASKWASEWPFKFPEYDPTTLKWRNGRWIEAEGTSAS